MACFFIFSPREVRQPGLDDIDGGNPVDNRREKRREEPFQSYPPVQSDPTEKEGRPTSPLAKRKEGDGPQVTNRQREKIRPQRSPRKAPAKSA